MKPNEVLPEKRRLALLLTITLVVNAAVLIWLGWYCCHASHEIIDRTQQQLGVHQLRATVVHLDEALSMSASGIAAAIGIVALIIFGCLVTFRAVRKWEARLRERNLELAEANVHLRTETAERRRVEEALLEARNDLERRVAERTAELSSANEALQAEIAERKRAEEKLMRAEKLAVLGQLAGGVGHELRNPLGAISNAAYFLNMVLKDASPEIKESLEILEKEVAASERIISSLLDFARPKAPSLRKTDVNDVVQEALRHVAVPEGVEIIEQLDDTLPEADADADQLGRVFGNIILNAIQAMLEGGRLHVRSELVGAQTISISFADTGPGISEENLARVFNPLFTTKAKGIGLGLALTRILVERQGGTVTAESTPGKGSTFTVTLRRAREEA